MDPTDGALYPKEVFMGLYGEVVGLSQWEKADPERRIDTTDGQPYPKQSFVDVYGGLEEWEAAPRWLPSPQDLAVWKEMVKAQQEMQAQQNQWMQEQQQPKDKLLCAREGADQKECRFVDDFRPTDLCVWMKVKGWCRNDTRCPFAHSLEELHAMSPDLPENQERGDEEPKKPELVVTKKKELCRRFATGKCLLGKICAEAHTQRELGTVGPSVQGFVKIELCSHFEQGKCKLGVGCGLAHGMKEIGQKRLPPDAFMTTPAKRPKHLPMFKEDMKNLHPDKMREYEEHLRQLEQVRKDHLFKFGDALPLRSAV